VVGVVGHAHRVPKPFGELSVTGSPTWYVDGLVAVGARAVLLPGPDARDLLDVVDALILTGGGDVDPALSGAQPDSCSDVDRTRDTAEIALVRGAAEAGVPLLGVCRGLQVLAVAFGGTLAGGVPHVRPYDGHEVTTAAGSLLNDLVGPRVHTSALHRQAVGDPGSRWRPTAWADDGTVEAVEWTGDDWPALGVQWHPELAWGDDLDDPTGSALFGWLRDVAATRSSPSGRLRALRRRAGPPRSGRQHPAGTRRRR
jgi:putative glutamine amidotransferase